MCEVEESVLKNLRDVQELPPVSSNDMQQESPASPDPAIAAETVG